MNPLSYTDPTGQFALLLPLAPAIADALATGAGYLLGGAGMAAILTMPSDTPLASRTDGEEKLPIVNPGRDCDGSCKPCPPGKRWFVPKPSHGHENGYWHTIVYNQDKKTCMCYPDRPSGGLEGF